MAKNVSLLGANYPDVPAVDLPQTGGGTARFTDVSGTTATDSDVLSGKTFFTANGVQKQGSLITHNVYDGLDSNSAVDALSAKQGKILNQRIQCAHASGNLVPAKVYYGIGTIALTTNTMTQGNVTAQDIVAAAGFTALIGVIPNIRASIPATIMFNGTNFYAYSWYGQSFADVEFDYIAIGI